MEINSAEKKGKTSDEFSFESKLWSKNKLLPSNIHKS